MDVIYFTINDKIVETYDKVSWNSNGDWKTFSIILVPNIKHTLTWSYQYNGLPTLNDPEYGMYDMDPRRVGNSWLDDILIEEYTGDVIFSDDGIDTKSLLYNIGEMAPPASGGRSWSLIHDTNAFLGTHSYIAYTEDISTSSGNYGYTELSWTILAGPTGGIMSFATFASVYAPHDVLEFSVDGIPEVLFTIPSDSWEQTYIQVEPGRHIMKWKLIKNVAKLDEDVMNEVEVPEDYQGYVKVDGIMYLDNQVHYDNAAAAAEEEEEETSTTTTEATDFTTTSTEVWSTTTEEPEEEEEETTTTTTEATTTEWITSTTTPEEITESTSTTEAIMAQNANAGASTSDSSGGCPDGLQQVEGLPNCCIEEPNYLGDGACDPWGPYNTPECAYDLGDCCYETCNHDSPYGCLMKEGNEDGVGPFGFFCLDPRYSVIDESKCEVENREWIGDGGCDVDGGYNTEECKSYASNV